MIIWQPCWINKEYNEVKLKKISFNLPLSWWGYKRLRRTEDPRSKSPPQWILWSSWSSKHGASRERTHPRAAETSSRSAEGNLLSKNQNNSKRQLQAKGVHIPPCSTFSFYKQKLVISQSKGVWRWSEHTLKPKTNRLQQNNRYKSERADGGHGFDWCSLFHTPLIIYQNRPTQGQIKNYRVGRGNSRPERMRPDKYCSRLKRNNMET